ncbi:MAG: MAPEG family protein [Pseudomonadota bacterium]
MQTTMFYAGLLAIWFFVLSWRVIQKRTSGKINLGDGGNEEMLRRIRGHANFAEYVPMALILIAMVEETGMAKWVVHALGGALLTARLLHGIAFSFTEKWFLGRFVGTLITFIVIVSAGGLCVWKGLAAI